MTNVLKIQIDENGTASLIREDGTMSAPVSLRVFGQADTSEYLPKGTRMVYSIGATTVYVIEQLPCVRSARWHPDPSEWASVIERDGLKKFGLTESDATRTEFQLAFPFVLFIVRVDNGEVKRVTLAFRKGAVLSENEYLYKCGLMQDDTFDIETGSLRTYGWNPAFAVNAVVDSFFDQSFMTLVNSVRDAHPKVSQFKTVWDWECASLRNSLWVLTASWSARPEHLARLVKSQALSLAGDEAVGDTTFDRMHAALVSATRLPDASKWKDLPSGSFHLNGKVVRVGDVLLAREDMPQEIKKGEMYEVAGFCQPARSTGLHMRLEGIAEPVLFHVRFLDYFELVRVKEKWQTCSLVTLADGFEIRAGMSLVSSDPRSLTCIKKPERITKLRVDDDGDVLAQFAHSDPMAVRDEWIYLTSNGGTLLSCIAWWVPELKDGVFTFADIRLSVGNAIRETGVYNPPILTVGEIFKDPENPDGYLLRFKETPEETTVLFGAGEFRFAWKPIHFERTDTKVALHDKRLDLEEFDHILVTRFQALLPYGTVQQILGFAPLQLMKHPNDVGILFENGIIIPIIKESVWVFPETPDWFQLVAVDSDTGLKQGTKMVVQTDDLSPLKKGDVLELQCLVPGKAKGSLDDLVFTNGLMIPLQAFVEKKLSVTEGNEQITVVASGAAKDLAVNRPFKIGDRVMYLGGDPKVNRGFDNTESLGTPGTIIRSGSVRDYWEIRFDKALPVGNSTGQAHQVIYGTYLSFYTGVTRAFHVIPVGEAVLIGKDGVMIPVPKDLLARRLTVPNLGKEFQKDCSGRMISIGDFVQPMTFGNDVYYYHSTANPTNVVDKHGLVIHKSVTQYGEGYIWLLHEEDADVGFTSSFPGYRGLPEWVLDANVRKRITICSVHHCNRFEFVPGTQPVEENKTVEAETPAAL